MSALNKFNTSLSHPNLGLLLLRLWLGVVGFYHGGQKLFGLFGGDIHQMIGMLQQKGVPAPTVSAYLSGCAEFFGGLLVAIGLFTRPAALMFAFNMLVAVFLVHIGSFAAPNGLEYPATLAISLVTVALVDPGRFSIDSAMGQARK